MSFSTFWTSIFLCKVALLEFPIFVKGISTWPTTQVKKSWSHPTFLSPHICLSHTSCGYPLRHPVTMASVQTFIPSAWQVTTAPCLFLLQYFFCIAAIVSSLKANLRSLPCLKTSDTDENPDSSAWHTRPWSPNYTSISVSHHFSPIYPTLQLYVTLALLLAKSCLFFKPQLKFPGVRRGFPDPHRVASVPFFELVLFSFVHPKLL